MNQDFIDRVNEIKVILENLITDAKSGTYDATDLKKKYQSLQTSIPYLYPVIFSDLNCKSVYRAVNYDGLNQYKKSSFSYYPLDSITENDPPINRLNLPGQSIFYASINAHTNFKEVRLNKEEGEIVYIGKWNVINGENINLFPLLRQYIDKIKNIDDYKFLYSYLNNFVDYMLEPFNNQDKWKYLSTAVVANAIYQIDKLPIMGFPSYDGIVYNSVQSEDMNELNIALKPKVVDKHLCLSYVIKGKVNKDYSIRVQEIGFCHQEIVSWYVIDIDQESINMRECFLYDYENTLIGTNFDEIIDGDRVYNSISELFNAKKEQICGLLEQQACKFAVEYDYDEIKEEKSLIKNISKYGCVIEPKRCLFKNRIGTLVPVKSIVFCISYMTKLKLIP